MARITITLKPNEKTALLQLAERERRYPGDQAAWLIRQALEAQDLLSDEPGDPAQGEPQPGQQLQDSDEPQRPLVRF